MSQIFPVTHSIPCTTALVSTILTDYGLGEISDCRLHSAGMNDTYRVNTVAGPAYYLRIYRTRWRSHADVLYELDALNHLHRKGIPVARPVRRRDGTFIHSINAPEGARFLVLFTEAVGEEPSYDSEPERHACTYGKAVAQLHNALDDFTSTHSRFHIDLDHLVENPLRHMEPFLAHRPADWAYVQQFTDALRERIRELPEEALVQGFCHGDLQGYHHHIADDGTMTFFDFDCCGYGYRAYDIAVFRWCARLSDLESIWWEPYWQGYLALRPVAEPIEQAIPLFVCARYIWHIGLHTENAYDWGHGWYGDAYFDKRLGFLRQLAEDYKLF